MKVWLDTLDWVNGAIPDRSNRRALVVETSQGRYTISELKDGSLEVNGGGPINGTTHESGFSVRPRSCNDVIVGYVTRTPPTCRPREIGESFVARHGRSPLPGECVREGTPHNCTITQEEDT